MPVFSPRRTLLFWSGIGIALLFPTTTALDIKVCQNKDCCARWKHSTSLPETLSDMLGDEQDHSVETTSCLGQCGHGPNMRVHHPRSGDMYLRGLQDATTVAAHLEAMMQMQVPSKLLAAVNVLEKAQKASSQEEKDRFLSSIIKALSADMAEYSQSTALIRALVLRAEMYWRAHDSFQAERDVEKAIDLVAGCKSTTPTVTRLEYQAYRLLADIKETQGDSLGAVEALEALATTNRAMKTKVKMEIERLREKSTLSS